MIPLSHWLSGQQRTPAGSKLCPTRPAACDQVAIGGDSIDFETRLAIAREQARHELRLETAAMISAAREEEQQAAESRQSAIVAEWTARCAEIVVSALSSLKQDLQKSVGKALDDVLQPLLPVALRHRATAILFELLDREFETAGDEVLEVRAPKEMHEKLRVMLDQQSIQAVLTESLKIEVLSRQGPSRFECLADAWASVVLPRET